MIKLSETVVVEGKCDKASISRFLDAHIIETDGFGVFNDREKLALLRSLAQKNGLVILTDSDGAGFVIRNYLKGALPADRVKHAYIPQISGKESRKSAPSAQGLLGVEAMSEEVIRQALVRAGVDIDPSGRCADRQVRSGITKAMLYADGLSGCAKSGEKRRRLLDRLGLPSYLTANSLLEVLNILCTLEEYKSLVKDL